MNAEYLKVKLSTTNKFDSQLFGKSNRNQGLDMDMDMDMDMEDEHDDDGKDGGDGVALVKELTEALIETYSLITIDAEPNVVRLWPTPTNHDIADAIADWFENEYYIFTAEAANHGNDGNDGDDGYSYQP